MVLQVGQRLSLKDQLCTIRYIGPVAEKAGEWLGVEWDDPARGKHDGSHGGKRYFECRSSSPTAASFLRPQQSWDTPRTFLESLRTKYMPEDSNNDVQVIYFSTKKAEEVGFDKFAKRQAQLQGIHVLVLDHMRMHWSASQDESSEITSLCSHVTELDLGGNLFGSLDGIFKIVSSLPKLARLTLDGNRFSDLQLPAGKTMQGIRYLGLSNTLLRWNEIAQVAQSFPNIIGITAVQNDLQSITKEALPENLQDIVLSENSFKALSDLANISSCPALETINLKRCAIAQVWTTSQSRSNACISASVRSIDLRENCIAKWAFFDTLGAAFPAMQHLQISGNPLYHSLSSAEGRKLTSEDGYMLTIARLPQLQTLNYSKISEKERLNAETYYLSQIAAELSRTTADQREHVLRKHPRWPALCDEYGEPDIQEQPDVNSLDPRSLVARLAKLSFHLAPDALPACTTRSWTQEIPKSFNVYALFGAVGKKLDIMPLKLRLIWETGEQQLSDRKDRSNVPEWWDSSDEEDEDLLTQHGVMVDREVELVPSTRPMGSYFEGREARVRITLKPG